MFALFYWHNPCWLQISRIIPDKKKISTKRVLHKFCLGTHGDQSSFNKPKSIVMQIFRNKKRVYVALEMYSLMSYRVYWFCLKFSPKTNSKTCRKSKQVKSLKRHVENKAFLTLKYQYPIKVTLRLIMIKNY